MNRRDVLRALLLAPIAVPAAVEVLATVTPAWKPVAWFTYPRPDGYGFGMVAQHTVTGQQVRNAVGIITDRRTAELDEVARRQLDIWLDEWGHDNLAGQDRDACFRGTPCADCRAGNGYTA